MKGRGLFFVVGLDLNLARIVRDDLWQPSGAPIMPETQMVLLREVLSGSANVGQSWPRMTIPDFSRGDALFPAAGRAGPKPRPQCE
jgi:hypothetical protein